MTYFCVVLTILTLALSANAFALPDCNSLKGNDKQKCEDQQRAEIRALIDSTNQMLENHQAQEQRWSEQVDRANQHLDNANKIMDDGLKRMKNH